MKEEHGMNVVLCSHLLVDVEEVCDEVVIMKDGQIVHQADLEEERRLNRRFVELEVSGDDAGLAEALREAGAEAAGEGNGRWRVVLPQELDMEIIWRVTAARNLGVRKLTHRRDTLEEIFLKAVGHLKHTAGETLAAEEVAGHGRL
jgi:ABC-type uncharacterized transport system ATPase subunit